MDIAADALFDGRPTRIIALIDAPRREAYSTVARPNFRAFDMVAELDGLARERERPKTLKVAKGPKLAGSMQDRGGAPVSSQQPRARSCGGALQLASGIPTRASCQ